MQVATVRVERWTLLAVVGALGEEDVLPASLALAPGAEDEAVAVVVLAAWHPHGIQPRLTTRGPKSWP